MKNISCSWFERLIVVKMNILPKQSTDSMQFLSNYQWYSSQSYNKEFYKLYGNTKDSG